ncbi:MAG: hypothetical protein AAGD25_15690 [Cyanobacteria bacterium P01_F01_bin.150]
MMTLPKLTPVNQPELIEQRPRLDQLLKPLSLAQTQELVQRLVAEQPELIEIVDRYANLLTQPDTPAKTSRPKRKTSVDLAPFKRRAREILRNALRDWEDGRDDDDIGWDMKELMGDALAFAEQGDMDNALVVLQGITEGFLKNWEMIEDFCGLTPQDVEVDFDSAWAEALLSAELTDAEALEWQERLEGWLELDSFSMALEALRQVTVSTGTTGRSNSFESLARGTTRMGR